MKEVSHEIRCAGNDAARSDIVADPVSLDDAAEIVNLMDVLLERVYPNPPMSSAFARSTNTGRHSSRMTDDDYQDRLLRKLSHTNIVSTLAFAGLVLIVYEVTKQAIVDQLHTFYTVCGSL